MWGHAYHLLWLYLVTLIVLLTARYRVSLDAKLALLVVFGCEYSSDVIPAAKTISAKTVKSSNRKQKDIISALT